MEEPRTPEQLGRELDTIPPRHQEIFEDSEEPEGPRLQDRIVVPFSQANTTNPPINNPDADRRLAEILFDQLLGSLDVNPNPNWGEAVVLGFQHYILSLGSTVMVPLQLVDSMGGSQSDRVEVVQTLLFAGGINTLLQTQFGTRLPIIIGGSHAFAVPIMSIIMDPSLSKITDPNLRFLKTMSVVQGSLIVASSLQILLGFSQTWGFCSRVFSSTTMVPLICLVGFGLFYRAFPLAADCIEMGVPLLIIYTILSQGLGTLLNGLFGGLTGSTVSIENVGLMGSTRVGSRRVAQISAGFMILFSMLGKLGALFASIPVSMFAAIHCIMFGIVASVGLSLMQFTNMNSARSMYIIAISIFMGLSVSEYFNKYTSMAVYSPVHSRATWINDFLNTVFLSSPAVALLVAVFLDRTLGYNGRPKEIGMQWWGRLRRSIRDIQTELFGVPFNMNWVFPLS